MPEATTTLHFLGFLVLWCLLLFAAFFSLLREVKVIVSPFQAFVTRSQGNSFSISSCVCFCLLHSWVCYEKSRQSDMEDLPFRKFRFVDFSTAIAGDFETGLLVDIIGVVDEVLFRYVSSKNTRFVFKLKDLSGQVLSCTLWENYCLQFLSYLSEVEDERPIVILLTHARIKEGQGSYATSISNSLKASKLMTNEIVFEIQEFKGRLLDLGIEVRSVLTSGGQGSSQVSGSSQLSSKDEFLSKAGVKNICQINAISEAGMYIGRYRIEVMVDHKGKQMKFLLWDCECVELIGQSVDEVNMLKIADGDVDLNASPQALDRLLGCFLAFKVKVHPRFRNVVVLKYSDESDLINVVLDMLPDTEVAFSKQSVSIIVDHDPLLRVPLTPTKRLSSDELDDESKNFEISPAQVSSNKVARHYRPE
ncbi:hypothetical protein JHK82_043720 [Glycine max]|nr:hypothetical protein JHK82_043720 [Glycine max]